MPEHQTPGVFVEEIPSGSRPIALVSTSIAGFVGLTASGPTTPRKVASFSEFETLYGGPLGKSYLSRAVEGFFANGGGSCYVARVVAENEGSTAVVSDYVGDNSLPVDERTGLAALESIDEISILSVPDEVRQTPEDLTGITQHVIAQCERLRDRFCITSVRQGQSDIHALSPRPTSDYAALYYPWLRVLDRRSKTEVLVPPAGHVAGVYARTDRDRGVHKAPANEPLKGVQGLEFDVTAEMQEILNPLGVNCLRDFSQQGRGILVWGARTLSSDPEWQYVSVRRLALFIEESLDQGTQWVVFEPNDEPLWARVRQSATDFLLGLWRSGAFQGAQAEEAFFVRCDSTTTTQADIDSGRLIFIVGFAPLKPAEFIVLRIEKKIAVTPS